MKKVGVVLVGLATVMLAGGCGGGDKLTCTKTKDSSEYVQEQKMAVTVKSEKIKKMEITSDTTFNKASDKEIETNYDLLKNLYSNFDEEGIDIEVTKDKKSVKAVISIDFDKAKEEDVKQFTSSYSNEKNDKISIDDIKKDMENDGFTCK